MKNFFMKPYRWAVVFSLLLICSFTYVLLDTFVIPQPLTAVEQNSAATTATSSAVQTASTSAASSPAVSETASASGISSAQSDPVVTDSSYEDKNIKISIDTVQKYNSTIYIADIQLTDASYLKTAFANDVFGRNIKETTSNMAAAHNAILAVNGDYYGFRNAGYVLRNGTLYRDTARNDGETDDLVIDKSGNFSIIFRKRNQCGFLEYG